MPASTPYARTTPRPGDPSQDVLQARPRPLDAVFRPRRVAVMV